MNEEGVFEEMVNVDL